jgi:hypothetical protein
MNLHSLLVSATELHERRRSFFGFQTDRDRLLTNRAMQAARAAASRKPRGEGRAAFRAFGFLVVVARIFVFVVLAFWHDEL